MCPNKLQEIHHYRVAKSFACFPCHPPVSYTHLDVYKRQVLYNTMLLNGSLYPHLMEVEQTAESQMQQTMEQLLKQTSAPDKENRQMEWVQHMNSLKAQAEELVLTELIYS